MEGEITVFISVRNKVVQLYPRELGSLFVASYDPKDAVTLTRFPLAPELTTESYIN
jgi:hypothetical protein